MYISTGVSMLRLVVCHSSYILVLRKHMFFSVFFVFLFWIWKGNAPTFTYFCRGQNVQAGCSYK